MKRAGHTFAVCCVIFALLSAAAPLCADEPPRNPKWATPRHEAGLPNLHRVSDRLYRGAQPTAEGMKRLHEMGVKTVINLRAFHSDRDEIGDTPLAYAHIRMIAVFPEEDEIVHALRILNDAERAPVFVHCMHGADRTGAVIAIYRIVMEGWTKEAAIDEMVHGGFGHHSIFKNLTTFIRELDVERIKQSLEHEERPNVSKPAKTD